MAGVVRGAQGLVESRYRGLLTVGRGRRRQGGAVVIGWLLCQIQRGSVLVIVLHVLQF